MPLSVTIWGARGSVPVPGPATVRYGGNTSCLTVENGDRLLVLDAGTGIRRLGRELAATGRAVDLTLLLTHTHWDHIQGIPFFRPLFRPGNRVTILGPPQPNTSLAGVLERQMHPTVFPVSLAAAANQLEIREIVDAALTVPGYDVAVTVAVHTAPTLGFRVSAGHGGPGFVYLTDNELGSPESRASRAGLVRFLRGADFVIHDAMYSSETGPVRRGFGHSTAVEAVELALEAQCRRLVLFHHDPDHDDVALERLLGEAHEARDRVNGALDILLAREGLTLRVED